MQAGTRRAAGHVKITATNLPADDSELRNPSARSWTLIVFLLLCTIGMAAAAVGVAPSVIDEISRLSKDPVEINLTEMYYGMPTRHHYFTDSEEQVSILEQVLDRDMSAKSPGLKSLTEILRQRIREGKTSAIATHKLLAEEIPSYCAGAWSASAESKVKVKTLEHYVKYLVHQVGHPAFRLRGALNSTQKIRLVVDDEEDATVKAMGEYDQGIDQTGRGWGSQIAWFSRRSRDPAEYTRLQARREVHGKILLALDEVEKPLWVGSYFWEAAQTAIESESLIENVERLERMVEGPFDEEAAEEILLNVLKVVQKTAMGKWDERAFNDSAR